MIITQTHKRRTFVGSLNSGTDVIESLKSICVDNAVLCATFNGVGYLEDPKIQAYNPAKKRFDLPDAHAGVLHAVSVKGNVSLHDRQTVIRCHVIGTLHEDEGKPALVSGELVAGSVVAFEFTLESVDDLRFYRDDDERTGLQPWLHMDLGEGPPRSPASQGPAPSPTPASAPMLAADRPDAPGSEPVELEPGDHLDHPTLGTCEVVDADDDDRLSIRLASGRVVEIHRALLHLAHAGDNGKGGTLYKASIRRGGRVRR